MGRWLSLELDVDAAAELDRLAAVVEVQSDQLAASLLTQVLYGWALDSESA